MKIVIYSKPNCPGCVSAKQFLKSKGLQFDEAILNTPEHLDAFARMHPEAKGMPQIFIQGQRVGGFAGLQAALRQLGL